MQIRSAVPPVSPNPWLPLAARIERITPEAPGVATYTLQLDDPAAGAGFRFQPGQFNMLYLPGFGESAISISSDPHHCETISHTVRVVGNVTGALSRLRVGDPVLLRGPFGAGWPMDECRGCDLVIAGGGLGLAPLRPAIHHVLHSRDEFERVILLYGARTPADLLYPAEYNDWRGGGIEVHTTVDLGTDDWQGHIGVVPQLFSRLRLDAPQTRVLTCGPEIMMRFVIFEALGRRISPEHILLSMERNMNCAVGLCGHCQLGPAFICKDGPVFTYEQMEPYLYVEDL